MQLTNSQANLFALITATGNSTTRETGNNWSTRNAAGDLVKKSMSRSVHALVLADRIEIVEGFLVAK